MGFIQKDEFTKLAEEIGELMNLIDASLSAGEPEQALASIRKAQGHVAGPMGGSLERLDAGSVIALLGAQKAELYAKLLRSDARAREAIGDAAGSTAAAARAAGIERALGRAGSR